MEDVTFTLPASWDYLQAWLQRFVAEHSPAGVTSCSLELIHSAARSRKYLWWQIDYDEFVLAIKGAYRGSVTLPLVEFTVLTGQRLTDRQTCTVTARCNEDGLADYFRCLLLTVVEQWPSTKQALEYANQLSVTAEKDLGQSASPLPFSPRMEAVIVKYRNFDLEAFDYKTTASGERFRVRVLGSPGGEQRLSEAETVSLPSELRTRLFRLERRGLTLSEMIALGEGLADALFPPRVRVFFERSRERLDEDEGLRVRLKLDTYALADLPWEYAYISRPGTPADQKGPDGFLVLDRSISLVRYEVLGQAPGSLDPVGAGPLRLVALLASPDTPGLAKLDLAAEQRNITQAVGSRPHRSAHRVLPERNPRHTAACLDP